MISFKLLTWNTRFIADNWPNRKKEISKILENQPQKHSIINIQEAAILGNNDESFWGKFSKKHNYQLFSDPSLGRGWFLSSTPIKWLLNKLFIINQLFFIILGNCVNFLYEIVLFRILFILFGTHIFFGITSLISKETFTILEKQRWDLGNYRVAHAIHLKYNNIPFWVINIHLSPSIKVLDYTNKQKRYDEVIRLFSNISKVVQTEDCFIMGDWNTQPTDPIFNIVRENNFVDVVYKIYDEHWLTYPTYNNKKPRQISGNRFLHYPQCVDYIWYRGESFSMNYCTLLGDEKCSDHYGISLQVSPIINP